QGSEKALGELGAAERFIIHTKAPGFSPGCLSKDSVLAASKKSLEELGTDSVSFESFSGIDLVKQSRASEKGELT
ncbi:hypothetical protein MMC27_003295, partial [Xylographa pallens]|nr:hypothetical protein [Xylographa pallens]